MNFNSGVKNSLFATLWPRVSKGKKQRRTPKPQPSHVNPSVQHPRTSPNACMRWTACQLMSWSVRLPLSTAGLPGSCQPCRCCVWGKKMASMWRIKVAMRFLDWRDFFLWGAFALSLDWKSFFLGGASLNSMLIRQFVFFLTYITDITGPRWHCLRGWSWQGGAKQNSGSPQKKVHLIHKLKSCLKSRGQTMASLTTSLGQWRSS